MADGAEGSNLHFGFGRAEAVDPELRNGPGKGLILGTCGNQRSEPRGAGNIYRLLLSRWARITEVMATSGRCWAVVIASPLCYSQKLRGAFLTIPNIAGLKAPSQLVPVVVVVVCQRPLR